VGCRRAFVPGVEPVVGIVLWLLVLANAGFSFWREYRAEKAMEALRRLLPVYARIYRNGEESNCRP
jgi:magnesium-transporting ATPase (P-type)